MRNGLGSPLCEGASRASLSAASRRDCETSAFVASASPTGDFGLDVHIDTGFIGVSSAQLLVIVQDLFVAPLWMALVWAVHALVVILEWCFRLDLFEAGSLRGSVAGSLRALQETITIPWLVLVLSVGGVLSAYHGLVRRRVAESLAQALLALAMTAVGIWLTLDPAGTIGALGSWANDASVGTLAVAARGSPTDSNAALADGFGALFAAAIEVPWCYLEFGDVNWCENPARLEPSLRAAALALAHAELKEAGCEKEGQSSVGCSSRGGEDAQALQRSARLLREARSNGAIFLALPANGPGRNAINDSGSLLRAICRSESATDCRGSAAAQAEFRTNQGTWPRVGGLLLIAVGVLGLLLLLGFVALRLLGAALFSLLYLMLAPAVALAPALGEAGREVFRRWAASLLAAVVSKLFFAFLLGVLLGLLALLEHLYPLGWWTRWLLMSVFWWGVFFRRHQILQLAGGERRGETPHTRFGALRRRGEGLTAPGAAYERMRAARERFRKPAPELGRVARSRSSNPPARPLGPISPEPGFDTETSPSSRTGSEPSLVMRDRARSSSGSPHPEERRGSREASDRETHSQLERVVVQRGRALAVANTRRAALLAGRAARLEAEAASAREHGALRHTQGRREVHERNARYERFLDAQARLRSDGEPVAAGATGYGALAGLAGYGRREYAQLDREGKRAARQAIDHELMRRRKAAPLSVAGRAARGGFGAPREPSAMDGGEFAADSPAARPESAGPSESIVMKDALEITARRRRQLGEGRR